MDYRKQPWKAFYLAYQSIATPLLRVPWWFVLSLSSSNRPRPTWSIKKTILMRLLKHWGAVAAKIGRPPSPYNHLAIAEDARIKGTWVYPATRLIAGEVKEWADTASIESCRVPGYWIEREGEDRPAEYKAEPGERVLYALHGGGYGGFSAHPTDPTSNVPRGILQHTKAVSRAFTIEYRLSKPSENPFPAALIDAISGYVYLVDTIGFQPENITVEGDSAGGHLAVSLVRYLVENKGVIPGLPAPPHDLILLSPWADLGISYRVEGTSAYTNIKSDFLNVLSGRIDRQVGNFVGKLGIDVADRNRYISPASTAATMEKASFEGFPRTLIVAGGAEVLRDQIRTLRDKMVIDIGEKDVEYFEPPDAVHDFVVLLWFEPERTQALERVANWLAK